MASNRFKVTERLYKDAEGNVVPAGDPDALTLFAVPGKTISMALAKELGLVDEASEEKTKVKTPSKNKMASPAAKKAAPAKALKAPPKAGKGK